MEYKGHTHVQYNLEHGCYNSWEVLTDIPYRFRVYAYLTTQEFNELSDDQKTLCNEIREVDFAIIDRLTAPENQVEYWTNYYRHFKNK